MKKQSKTAKPKVLPKLPEFAGLTKNAIISELAKSPHGRPRRCAKCRQEETHATANGLTCTSGAHQFEPTLEAYLPLREAARQDPEFFAHLTTWNAAKGEVKDARCALPIISLREATHPEFVENALANLAGLDPRLFVRALTFGHTLFSREWKLAKRLVERRLRDLEANPFKWNRTAAQHRASLHYLYRRYRVSRPEFVARNIFEEERGQRLPALPGTVFHAIQQLPHVPLEEAAGLILRHKIPFLTVKGALGKKATDPAVAFALIGAMTPTELLHNTKDLEKNYNIKRDPALRAAYEQALEKAGVSKKGPSLKATKAADAMEDIDEVLATKLKAVQEKRMESLSIEGNWLVLGDKSGSMEASIALAVEVAATLTRAVKGTVHLVFFDTSARAIDCTGKTYDEVRKLCQHVTAIGSTSIGVGLQYAMDSGLDVDGITIISDGGENHPPYFHMVYPRYAAKIGKEPPIYFYRVPGETNRLSTYCRADGITLTEFDLTSGADYYSLPNLVQTMRVNRFSLQDEIMGLPLLTLDEVLPNTKGMTVLARERVHA